MNLSKECTKCKEEKLYSEFNKSSKYKDGHQYVCRQCISDINKGIYAKPEIKEKQRESLKIWKQLEGNKERIAVSTRKYQNGARHKLRTKYCTKLRYIIFKALDKDTTHEFIGCSGNEMIKHIESLFTAEMSWGNYNQIWNLDHKLPLRSFNLEDFEQVKLAFHYSNTRPVLIEDNNAKIDKMPDGTLARDRKS